MRRAILVLLLVGGLAGAVVPDARAEVTAEQVRVAIERGVDFLKRQQRTKVTDPFDTRAPETDAVFWNTRSTHDPKDILDTCFTLLFLKRATRNLAPAPITPGEGGPTDNR